MYEIMRGEIFVGRNVPLLIPSHPLVLIYLFSIEVSLPFTPEKNSSEK